MRSGEEYFRLGRGFAGKSGRINLLRRGRPATAAQEKHARKNGAAKRGGRPPETRRGGIPVPDESNIHEPFLSHDESLEKEFMRGRL
jgi:hypothetical protein